MPGMAYLVYDDAKGLYKVGSTHRPIIRLKALAVVADGNLWLVWKTDCTSPRLVEYEFKRRWAAKQYHGDWYDLDAADVAEFKSFTAVWWGERPPRRDPLEFPPRRFGRPGQYEQFRVGEPIRKLSIVVCDLLPDAAPKRPRKKPKE